MTDKDLPPIARTEGNYWRAKYFQAIHELSKANKGIRRLKKCLEKNKRKSGLTKSDTTFLLNCLDNVNTNYVLAGGSRNFNFERQCNQIKAKLENYE